MDKRGNKTKTETKAFDCFGNKNKVCLGIKS